MARNGGFPAKFEHLYTSLTRPTRELRHDWFAADFCVRRAPPRRPTLDLRARSFRSPSEVESFNKSESRSGSSAERRQISQQAEGLRSRLFLKKAQWNGYFCRSPTEKVVVLRAITVMGFYGRGPWRALFQDLGAASPGTKGHAAPRCAACSGTHPVQVHDSDPSFLHPLGDEEIRQV